MTEGGVKTWMLICLVVSILLGPIGMALLFFIALPLQVYAIVMDKFRNRD